MGIEDILIDTAKQVTRDMGYGGITFASPSVGKWIDAVEGSGFEPFMIHYVLDLGVDDESD